MYACLSKLSSANNNVTSLLNLLQTDTHLQLSTLEINGGVKDVERLFRVKFELSSDGLFKSRIYDAVVEVLDNGFKGFRGEVKSDNTGLCFVHPWGSLHFLSYFLRLQGNLTVKVENFVIVADDLNNVKGLRQISNFRSTIGCLCHFFIN